MRMMLAHGFANPKERLMVCKCQDDAHYAREILRETLSSGGKPTALPHRRNRPARLPPQHGHHPAQFDHLGAVSPMDRPRLSYPLNSCRRWPCGASAVHPAPGVPHRGRPARPPAPGFRSAAGAGLRQGKCRAPVGEAMYGVLPGFCLHPTSPMAGAAMFPTTAA